jgi:transposase
VLVARAAAVRLGGVGACSALDGATDTACFESDVERCLVPTRRAGDIVVMDNLNCHKTAEVARLIGSAGAEVRYWPAYRPDLNPIEQLFSKLKEALRSAAARTVDTLIDAMGDALRTVRPDDILGWPRTSEAVMSRHLATRACYELRPKLLEPLDLRRQPPPQPSERNLLSLSRLRHFHGIVHNTL